MSNFKYQISKDLAAKLPDVEIVETTNGVTCTVPLEAWVETARLLRDDKAFQFEQCVDVCGVDYLTFGEAEWQTDGVSSTGFSRGIKAKGPGRFSWHERREESMPNRFAVVAQLLSVALNHRLTIKCFAPDEGMLMVPSLIDVWPGVNWFEREAFDLFGIIFKGHPDLRRILTDYGFIGHPFRKDFPLIGNVEVIYDEEQQRVVYQPVSIEPRVLVPKTIRRDSRYVENMNDQEAS
ncbi:NADH-quinone oxidoreductase subunit C [Marinicella sp. S1101]|uniref:NADH-quinone oxidoreductase subunit C n=1 Tax=Marinicella marina TaxID=2996016 RepID=UPI002260F5F8|nr:NADH-quinone oxidoreductase subunit C [Marinicella marina]MCX7554113.1 NADH-quinone oxidoreductase subunit C [Marinicella marina]MDJ1141194.1 NADH-quinone oxidoreductase subunit C [Marinicella marina]